MRPGNGPSTGRHIRFRTKRRSFQTPFAAAGNRSAEEDYDRGHTGQGYYDFAQNRVIVSPNRLRGAERHSNRFFLRLMKAGAGQNILNIRCAYRTGENPAYVPLFKRIKGLREKRNPFIRFIPPADFVICGTGGTRGIGMPIRNAVPVFGSSFDKKVRPFVRIPKEPHRFSKP